MKKLLTLLLATFISAGAQAAEYTIDYAQSALRFHGKHAGNDFSGVFEKWQANIIFDHKHPEQSRVTVTIDTASAKTGNLMYDGTLPTEDWFNVKAYPEATFVSQSIIHLKENNYQAKGLLSLRGVTLPVKFMFTLVETNTPEWHVVATSQFDLDRLAFAIGTKSDANAEWVGRTIGLDLNVTARRNE